ncbi:MAG TPA: S1 RNA-binding domain-containing protein [Nevskiaceae bacterium]|nr:S1 RNA-binding domain-containing protein [Nevskiaceae bacterium]
MEQLLTQSGYQLRGWQRGDLVEGILVEKTKSALYLDIGGKSEGMVIDRELKAARDFIKELKAGDKVAAVITQVENDKGQTLMSLKRAAFESLWSEFEKKLKTGETLKVQGREANKGGLIVSVKGFQGFIPTSQFGAHLKGKLDSLIGKTLEVKVTEVNREKNRLILSEREVSEAALLKDQEKALKKVKVGDVFSGEITGVMPFGFFVKVIPKGSEISLEGLVHISEVSWEKVDDLSKFYEQGDEVKVRVLSIDQKSGKLNLSIKQLIPDPWEGIEKEYSPDAQIKGEVVKVVPFGVLVKLKPGIEGLIHISKIPVEQSIKVGDKVNCFIESVDPEHRRISLGLVLKKKPVGYK